MTDQNWTVSLAFTEDGDHTRADATLALASGPLHGVGHAKRAPHDPSVPVVGQDLAAARALSDLAHQLVHAAAARIEAYEGHPVRLHE